jgi:hypothetical protein
MEKSGSYFFVGVYQCFFRVFFLVVYWHHYTHCGRQSSNNVATICSYDHNMEVSLIKSGYHNEYHVENLASIFFIFTPI